MYFCFVLVYKVKVLKIKKKTWITSKSKLSNEFTTYFLWLGNNSNLIIR